MENIIKKAIEGGYDIYYQFMCGDDIPTYLSNDNFTKDKYQIFCDPLFWSALAKSCGWKKYIWLSYPDYTYDSYSIKEFTDDDNFSPDSIGRMGECKYAARYITYLHYAHCFHDINLTKSWDESVSWLSNLIKE